MGTPRKGVTRAARRSTSRTSGVVLPVRSVPFMGNPAKVVERVYVVVEVPRLPLSSLTTPRAPGPDVLVEQTQQGRLALGSPRSPDSLRVCCTVPGQAEGRLQVCKWHPPSHPFVS